MRILAEDIRLNVAVLTCTCTCKYDVLNDVTVSRLELLERAEAVAANLVSRGCRSGDVIAIFAHNSVEWVIMLTAALRIDAVVAGINALLTAGPK